MRKYLKGILFICLCILRLTAITSMAYPASQGTDGTELQVFRPATLEIQLGPEWAGTEFSLRTDVGVYPGNITVGNNGVLKLEIGGSSSYIISRMSTAVTPSVSEELQAPATQSDVNQNNTKQNVNKPDKKPLIALIITILCMAIALAALIYCYNTYCKGKWNSKPKK